jgi:hypothetical protein
MPRGNALCRLSRAIPYPGDQCSNPTRGLAREQQRKTIQLAAEEFLTDYRTKHQSATFAEYARGHVSTLLGGSLVVEITPNVVKRYQADRLNER